MTGAPKGAGHVCCRRSTARHEYSGDKHRSLRRRIHRSVPVSDPHAISSFERNALHAVRSALLPLLPQFEFVGYEMPEVALLCGATGADYLRPHYVSWIEATLAARDGDHERDLGVPVWFEGSAWDEIAALEDFMVRQARRWLLHARLVAAGVRGGRRLLVREVASEPPYAAAWRNKVHRFERECEQAAWDALRETRRVLGRTRGTIELMLHRSGFRPEQALEPDYVSELRFAHKRPGRGEVQHAQPVWYCGRPYTDLHGLRSSVHHILDDWVRDLAWAARRA